MAPSADPLDVLPSPMAVALVFVVALVLACGVVRVTIYGLTGY